MQIASYEYIVTLSIYFLIIFALCYFANKRTRDLSDYVLGHRSLSGPIVALGAGASDMSGWLLLALPGAVFVHGLNQIWMPIGLLCGAYLNWRLVSPRLRAYTEIANNALTIPAYFDNRFHDTTRVLRLVTAAAILIFFTVYASAGFVSGALLFESAFHLSYHTALWISAVFVIIYTAFGGFLAISWIDFFQGSLMFFALIITPLYTLHHMGGWHKAFHQLMPLGAGYLQPLHGMTTIGLLSLLGWGLGYFGQPHILVRFMAIRSVKELPTAWRICMSWMFIGLVGAVVTGLVGHAYYTRGLLHPEGTFLLLAKSMFLPWVTGILLAAVLSAIMSSSSAQLLISSSALTEDMFHRFLRRRASQSELVFISRLMVGAIALVAIGLAYNPKNSILELVSYAWGGLGAAFGPVILGSLFWRRMKRMGAISGIAVGALTAIVWKSVLSHYGGVFAIYEIIPGALLATFSIITVSLLGSAPSEQICCEFDQARANVQGEKPSNTDLVYPDIKNN